MKYTESNDPYFNIFCSQEKQCDISDDFIESEARNVSESDPHNAPVLPDSLYDRTSLKQPIIPRLVRNRPSSDETCLKQVATIQDGYITQSMDNPNPPSNGKLKIKIAETHPISNPQCMAIPNITLNPEHRNAAGKTITVLDHSGKFSQLWGQKIPVFRQSGQGTYHFWRPHKIGASIRDQ